MRSKSVLLLLLTCFAVAVPISSPDQRTLTDPKTITSAANPKSIPVPIEDLFYTRMVSGGAWSPDGRQVVLTTNLTGRLNLWKVAAAGGWPIQLSQSDDRQYSATWSPDGKWIVYEQDKGGDEIFDLYAIPADGGAPVNLTNTPVISETGARFSPDGKAVVFGYKPKVAPVNDLALLDWQTRKVRKLTEEADKNYSWEGPVWSADGHTIYASRTRVDFADADIYSIDVASGQKLNLTAHQGSLVFLLTDVSPDGRTLLVTSNQKGGFNNVALLDVATKKFTWVTDLKWEASAGDFSPDGKSFTYEVNEDGRTDTYICDISTLRAQKLTLPEGLNAPVGNPRAWSPDGRELLLSHQSSQQPADRWVYDVANRQARQLTFSVIASLNPADLPASHLVHYKSFDGQIISAFLWVPFNLKRDASNPGIVLPHGGPTSQTEDSFSRTAQALVTRGFVCIAPNVRGSTGYGLAFQKANTKDLGGGDLQDEVYAARFLADTGYVNPHKVGITGGSYGGYMTLMALGKTPDVWAAGVEQYGIVNWFTMLQHEDPFLQQYEKSLLGDPEKDRAIYENASPLKYLNHVRAPLLVLQGDNDIRVPKEEAEQVVSTLKQRGMIVDAHFYPDEGHGFAKRENQIDAIRRTVDWFTRYLKGIGR